MQQCWSSVQEAIQIAICDNAAERLAKRISQSPGRRLHHLAGVLPLGG